MVGRAGGHVGGGEVDPPNGSFRLMREEWYENSVQQLFRNSDFYERY